MTPAFDAEDSLKKRE
jgi:hypothetical protein